MNTFIRHIGRNTKYTKDSTQIHKNQVHKKDKTEKQ